MMVCVLCVGSMLVGCADSEKKNQIENGSVEGKTQEEFVREPIKIGNGELYSWGEVIKLEDPLPTIPNNIAEEYTIQAVQIFESPEEADIPREQIQKNVLDILYYSGEGIEEEFEYMDVDKDSLLVCDMTIKNINRDPTDLNISRISLVYQSPDTGKIDMISEIAYFSKSIEMDLNSQKLWHYDLAKGETMEAKVAWLIDLERYDLENLYIGIVYDGDYPKYVKVNSK